MLTLSCWYWLSKGEGSYAVSITLQQNHSQLPAWMVGLWVKPVCRGEEIRLQLCRHWQSACLRTILLTVFLFVFCKSYTSCSCIKHFLAQLNLHIRHDFGIQNYVLFAIIIQLFALCIYIHIYTYIYMISYRCDCSCKNLPFQPVLDRAETARWLHPKMRRRSSGNTYHWLLCRTGSPGPGTVSGTRSDQGKMRIPAIPVIFSNRLL